MIFSLRKYLEYLLSLDKDKNQHNNPINYLQDNLQNIQIKSKEKFSNLDKKLGNITDKLTSNLNEPQNETENNDKLEVKSIRPDVKIKKINKRTPSPVKDFKLTEQKLNENSKATRVPSSRLGN